MMISGFGNYHKIKAQCFDASAGFKDLPHPLIARGCGSSYGDSALAPNILDMTSLNYFISFEDGYLTAYAGVTLFDIIRIFLQKGYFLPVTPGTQFVTLGGGAIASDVHGKNHHQKGTFCKYVTSMTLWLGDDHFITITKDSHPDLWHATCGGQGLTGIIVKATLKLMPISGSQIRQQNIKATSLKKLMELLEKDSTYSVAWFDIQTEHSILMLGEHMSGSLNLACKHTINLPKPPFLLNNLTIPLFNNLYKKMSKEGLFETDLLSFFYPLDRISNWNQIYGKKGFVQYQFVLPHNVAFQGIQEILKELKKFHSALCVLKKMGSSNDNYLSFPLAGYTLAMDFKATPGIIKALAKVDEIVINYNGRVYLTKDAVMSEVSFKKMYPKWEDLQAVREKYGVHKLCLSNQAKRLGMR